MTNRGVASCHAVLIGKDVGELHPQLQGYGIGALHVVAAPTLELYNPLHWTTALHAAVKACQPQLLLGIASPLGRDLLARLAARLDCGLLSDVVQAEVSGDAVQALKPMYAGKCLAQMKLNCAPLGILALRPNVFPPAQQSGTDTPPVQEVAVELPEVALVTKEIRQGASDKPDLTEAPTIISGGRAMASADNFKNSARVCRSYLSHRWGLTGGSRFRLCPARHASWTDRQNRQSQSLHRLWPQRLGAAHGRHAHLKKSSSRSTPTKKHRCSPLPTMASSVTCLRLCR